MLGRFITTDTGDEATLGADERAGQGESSDSSGLTERVL